MTRRNQPAATSLVLGFLAIGATSAMIATGCGGSNSTPVTTPTPTSSPTPTPTASPGTSRYVVTDLGNTVTSSSGALIPAPLSLSDNGIVTGPATLGSTATDASFFGTSSGGLQVVNGMNALRVTGSGSVTYGVAATPGSGGLDAAVYVSGQRYRVPDGVLITGATSDNSAVTGGNAAGTVLVGLRVLDSGTSTQRTEPVVWTAPTGAPGVFTETVLPLLSGYTSANAVAVNAAGDVIGRATTSSSTGDVARAVVWRGGANGSGSSPIDISSTTLNASAAAINDSGDIAIQGNDTAWVRIANGTIYSLVGLSGYVTVEVFGIAPNGDVVGESFAPTGNRAVLWQRSQSYNNPIDLSSANQTGGDWTLTSANAINSNNQIVCSGSHNGTDNHVVILTLR